MQQPAGIPSATGNMPRELSLPHDIVVKTASMLLIIAALRTPDGQNENDKTRKGKRKRYKAKGSRKRNHSTLMRTHQKESRRCSYTIKTKCRETKAQAKEGKGMSRLFGTSSTAMVISLSCPPGGRRRCMRRTEGA